jgi:hypothetical protein
LQAELFKELADSELYHPVTATGFKGKALAILRGEPEWRYLPPVPGDGRDLWIPIKEQARRLSADLSVKVTPDRVRRLLEQMGLHGKQDTEHKWSYCYSDFTPVGLKRYLLYLYNPAAVMPPLRRACMALDLPPKHTAPRRLFTLITADNPECGDGQGKQEPEG